MASYEKVCKRCGTAFVAGSKRAMYCPPCRLEVRREYHLEYYKNHIPMPRLKREKEIYTNDTLENVQKCLNCKRITCHTGECPEVARKKKEGNHG